MSEARPDLEVGIKRYLEMRGEDILPDAPAVLVNRSELYIKTIREATRDKVSLENLLTDKKLAIESTSKIYFEDQPLCEEEALTAVYWLVRLQQMGKPYPREPFMPFIPLNTNLAIKED